MFPHNLVGFRLFSPLLRDSSRSSYSHCHASLEYLTPSIVTVLSLAFESWEILSPSQPLVLLRTSEIIFCRELYSLRSPSLSLPCRTDESSSSLQAEPRFEASITQSVLAIVLCVIGYLLVSPRLELDCLKDFYSREVGVPGA